MIALSRRSKPTKRYPRRCMPFQRPAPPERSPTASDGRVRHPHPGPGEDGSLRGEVVSHVSPGEANHRLASKRPTDTNASRIRTPATTARPAWPCCRNDRPSASWLGKKTGSSRPDDALSDERLHRGFRRCCRQRHGRISAKAAAISRCSTTRFRITAAMTATWAPTPAATFISPRTLPYWSSVHMRTAPLQTTPVRLQASGNRSHSPATPLNPPPRKNCEEGT